MLDDELSARGVRDACEISIVMPLGTPVPPSPETSAALEEEFAARNIKLLSGRRVTALDRSRSLAVLDDDSELPPDRHLGQGTCYIEFGHGRIGSVDIDFLSGPSKTGTFNAPSAEQMAQKERFGSSRRARWFGAPAAP
jgi:hypothetical protein